ncbi:MAG: alpha-galactosidase [Phocaeicola sp.]|uniref:alpha-galactosidase n=1 Tax=Phocaeicola sp. TaxID=2773926 RepID=UPI003FA11215
MKNVTLTLLCFCTMLISCGQKQQNQTSIFKEGEFKEWAQTPPMGWNSWDCYGPTVMENEVKANADYMATNLKEYGWEYVVVDIRWFVENDKAGGYNQDDPRYVLDEFGRYQPAVNRFPSAGDGKGFKALADYVHSKGLKFGIHIMRGIPKEAVMQKLPIKGTKDITADQIYSTENQCEWLKDNYTVVASKPGAQEYYNSIFDMYADWGVDFVKIDDISRPYHKDEIELVRHAIDQCGRPIVLSLSPGKTPILEAKHVSNHANMWRMVDDVWDVWKDIPNLMKVAEDWFPNNFKGTWPDCDMIPLGHISIRGERGEDRMTRLTKEEQYTLMTLFTIVRSPLMYGGDLPTMDDFTLSLLTNKEVLRMHRDAKVTSYEVEGDSKYIISSVNQKTGECYLAFFNLNDDKDADFTPDLARYVGTDAMTCVNLWTGEKVDCGKAFAVALKPHCSVLYKFQKQ